MANIPNSVVSEKEADDDEEEDDPLLAPLEPEKPFRSNGLLPPL